jgi:hypothetical protein
MFFNATEIVLEEQSGELGYIPWILTCMLLQSIWDTFQELLQKLWDLDFKDIKELRQMESLLTIMAHTAVLIICTKELCKAYKTN